MSVLSSSHVNLYGVFAEKLKACGHPLRLELLSFLLEEENCVAELRQKLNIPQPIVSQHLSVLKKKGVVSCYSLGTRRIYKIDDSFVCSLVSAMKSIN